MQRGRLVSILETGGLAPLDLDNIYLEHMADASSA